jgi:uncharacterized protein YyaL (SSP411 family)
MTIKHRNKLIDEKSPYLLQHAENPVDWFPWGEEAFKKARTENKPIFLSIGYSTCHWCHVMEEESFKDLEVAKLLNNTFISIKVDKEERPDIDSIYMSVCHMITGGGGWPLTIIMTPDKKPFFAATYIPKETRFGRSGLLEIIPKINGLWTKQRDDLLFSANQITMALQQIPDRKQGKLLDVSTLKLTFNQLKKNFDRIHGGFGRAPKFPTPHNLLFLLRYWKRSGDGKALEMVEKTLHEMRLGGIYDHIGFGFHRYSTDAHWLLPHFEKMLYDQALLSIAYIEAYQATGNEEFAKTAKEILNYVQRDMTAPSGGFYSAEDADSEGEEGKFYLWSMDEINKILGSEEAEMVIKIFNCEKDGNYIDPMIANKTGYNILHTKKTIKELTSDFNISTIELEMRMETARQKLFHYRDARIHPHKDDKILTDWNGLMIAAFAKGAQVFDDPNYLENAEKAVEFIFQNLLKSNGRLLHRYRDGESAVLAYLDDYAFFIWGLIELYEATFNEKYLKYAVDLNKKMLSHFWDDDVGGLYFTADDAEELILRQKEIYDGAIPSGNSISILNLLRLSKMTGDQNLEKKAESLQRAFSEDIKNLPLGHTQLMVGLDYAIGPSFEVVIEGDPKSKETQEMLKAIRSNFIPNKIVHQKSKKNEMWKTFNLPDLTSKQSETEKKTKAYVCVNYSCQEPTSSVSRMLELLKSKGHEQM